MDDFPNDGPLSRNIDRETEIMKSKLKAEGLKTAIGPLLRIFFTTLLFAIFGIAIKLSPSQLVGFIPLGTAFIIVTEGLILTLKIKKEIDFQEKTKSEKE